jgi:hypothetical protein
LNKELFDNNYLVIRNFIDREKALHLGAGFESQAFFEGTTEDPQAMGCPSLYNSIPIIKLLIQKLPDASIFCGEQLLPTYCYGRVYNKKGVELKAHTDRPACELSITLNLFKDRDWPIFIKTPDGTEVSVELDPGDAMMYLGTRAEHWREPFPGGICTQVFLHYVFANGKNAWAFFDKNKREPS